MILKTLNTRENKYFRGAEIVFISIIAYIFVTNCSVDDNPPEEPRLPRGTVNGPNYQIIDIDLVTNTANIEYTEAYNFSEAPVGDNSIMNKITSVSFKLNEECSLDEIHMNLSLFIGPANVPLVNESLTVNKGNPVISTQQIMNNDILEILRQNENVNYKFVGILNQPVPDGSCKLTLTIRLFHSYYFY